MKTPPDDHDLIRWLDGEMSPSENAAFERRLEADPSLQMEAQEMKRISSDLRLHLPVEMPVPYGDFFNSQIQVRLAQQDKVEERREAPARWYQWLITPSFLATTTAVLVAGIMIWKGQPTHESLVLATYAPDPNVHTQVYHSAEADATVLLLEGLAEMPADRKFVSYQIQRSETDQARATTTLYGLHDEPVLILAKDSRNQPILFAASARR